jgi:hypothetical protein
MLDEMCTQQHFEYIESLTGHEQKNIVPSFYELSQPSQILPTISNHERR